MWIQRTPEEATKWHTATAREARTHGLLVAGGSWLVLTAILAAGWIAGGRIGVVAQDSVAAGGFWTRLPIFAVLGLPLAFWFFRHERQKALERSLQMTICPNCEIAGESNAGVVCSCGATFVLQRAVCDGLTKKKPRLKSSLANKINYVSVGLKATDEPQVEPIASASPGARQWPGAGGLRRSAAWL